MSEPELTGSPMAGRLRRRDRNRAAIAASLAALVLATVIMALVVRFASQRPESIKLGNQVFEFDAERLARDIRRQGEPLLFKDPLTRRPGREVYVQHLGRDHRTGWVAVDAYAPGQRRELRCILDWDPDTRQFRDPCSAGHASFPADGSGLRTYPAEVNDDAKVVIDLRTQP